MHAAQLPLDWSVRPGADFPHAGEISPKGNSAACRTAPRSRVRARRTDPATSHAAAANAERFAASHAGRILAALNQLGSATAHEIAHATGLTVVQIDRRLPELERQGRARVVRDAAGEIVQRGSARVWEAVR